MGAGLVLVGAAGALLLLLTLIDVFVTVFNYDGFTFIADRFHHLLWRALRGSSTVLPVRQRGAFLSLTASSMLPATIALWLGLEITAFAMMYLPGVAGGDFVLKHHLPLGAGTSFYLSGGAITSLVFGDVEAKSALYGALTTLETIVGLGTLTLALTYVLTALGVLNHIDRLHGRVRRNAEDPERPSSVLTRHFRSPSTSQLPGLLQALTDDLDRYDQGLRRYPVVYYFHTRRIERSLPRVFAALGELIALACWGLPSDEPLTDDPSLRALSRQYLMTMERMERSLTHHPPRKLPPPVAEEEFWQARRGERHDPGVEAFGELETEARCSAGLPHRPEIADGGGDAAHVYRRYREWLAFAERRRSFVDGVARSLGYEQRPEPPDVPALVEGRNHSTAETDIARVGPGPAG
ncbi:MAG: hypothetical protein J2P59_00400 [Acidimicrobiales bacterium]|nr:hypothetical protein [Acidimicrobiales bacterium]MBO0886101.1 hypothetical protein [Acidimicrobiales bacterium]